MKLHSLPFYGRAYQMLMRLSHRFNWHHTVTIHPDGDTMIWCQWCGMKYVSHRRGYKPAISTAGAQGQSTATAPKGPDK